MPQDKIPQLTAAAAQQWAQRIRKEQAINGQIRQDGFSVRASIRSQDVPARFKPTHADATQLQRGEMDLEQDVQAALDSQRASPRQRFMMPETVQHDVGWLVQAPGPSGAAAASRSNSTRPQVGSSTSGCGAFDGLDHGSARQEATGKGGIGGEKVVGGSDAVGRSAIKRVVLAGRLPRSGIGWESSSSPKNGASATPRGGGPSHGDPGREPLVLLPEIAAASAGDGKACKADAGRAVSQPPKKHDVIAGPLSVISVNNSAEDRWCSATPRPGATNAARPESKQDRAVQQAVARTRVFLNGPGCQWYRPKGTSDVVQFGDAFVRSFGHSIFNSHDK